MRCLKVRQREGFNYRWLFRALRNNIYFWCWTSSEDWTDGVWSSDGMSNHWRIIPPLWFGFDLWYSRCLIKPCIDHWWRIFQAFSIQSMVIGCTPIVCEWSDGEKKEGSSTGLLPTLGEGIGERMVRKSFLISLFNHFSGFIRMKIDDHSTPADIAAGIFWTDFISNLLILRVINECYF